MYTLAFSTAYYIECTTTILCSHYLWHNFFIQSIAKNLLRRKKQTKLPHDSFPSMEMHKHINSLNDFLLFLSTWLFIVESILIHLEYLLLRFDMPLHSCTYWHLLVVYKLLPLWSQSKISCTNCNFKPSKMNTIAWLKVFTMHWTGNVYAKRCF